MTQHRTSLLFGLATVVLLGGAAFAFTQEPLRSRFHAGHQARAERGEHGRGERLREFAGRMRQARERVRELELTQQQRDAVRDAARRIQPLADEYRPQLRALVERARELRRQGDVEGAKALLRDELRPLVERARADGERHTRPLLESLTPEQRAKVEAGARARGRQFDEDRAAGRLGLLLGSRRAQQRLCK